MHPRHTATTLSQITMHFVDNWGSVKHGTGKRPGTSVHSNEIVRLVRGSGQYSHLPGEAFPCLSCRDAHDVRKAKCLESILVVETDTMRNPRKKGADATDGL